MSILATKSVMSDAKRVLHGMQYKSWMTFSQELTSWVTTKVNHCLFWFNHCIPKLLKSIEPLLMFRETLPPRIRTRCITTCSAWNKSLLRASSRRHWVSGRKYLVPYGPVWPALSSICMPVVAWKLMPKSIKTNSTSASCRTTPPELQVFRRHMTFLGERSPWYHPASCSSRRAASSSEATYTSMYIILLDY